VREIISSRVSVWIDWDAIAIEAASWEQFGREFRAAESTEELRGDSSRAAHHYQ